jgi:hypothetical protein
MIIVIDYDTFMTCNVAWGFVYALPYVSVHSAAELPCWSTHPQHLVVHTWLSYSITLVTADFPGLPAMSSDLMLKLKP